MTRKIPILTILLALFLSSISLAGTTDDALALIKKRHFNQAIELLQRGISKDPGFADLHYLLGRAYYEKGVYDSAATALDQALDRKRKHTEAQYYRALVYIAQENFDKAYDLLGDRAEKEKNERDKAMFYNGLALYYLAQDKFDDADYNFRMSLVYDANNIEYQRNLADLSYEQGYYGSASQQYQEIVAKDSTDMLSWFKLGKSLYFQKSFADAVQALSRAIELDSAYIPSYQVSGDIFMIYGLSQLNADNREGAQERFRNAVWMYQHYLDNGGEKTGEIAYRLGQAYYHLNAYPQSLEEIDKAIAMGYEKSNAYDMKAKSLFRMKEFDRAIGAYEEYETKISGGDPNYEWTAQDFDFFKERALTLYQLYVDGRQEGNADSTLLERAIPDYVKALELKPEDPIAPQLYVQLGLSYYYLGRFEEAIPWFQKKIEADPGVYNTYLNLGYCYLKQGDNERVIETMKRVVELNPDYCPAYSLIARTYLSAKNFSAAIEWFDKLASCDSSTYEPYKWKGYVAISDKPPRKEVALRELLACVNKMESTGISYCDEIDVITWLAQAYTMFDDSDKEDEAVKWAKRGLKCDPGNATLQQIVKDFEY
ncbi:MAG: tetratricopeptide repeat protein [bacterium]